MAKKFTRSKEDLEFIDGIRKILGDQNPRSYGLYVKLFKEFGKTKMLQAATFAADKPANYRLRYFLGILSKERESRSVRRRIRKQPEIEPGDSVSEVFLKMREKLIRKMTPPYERISRTRSRLGVKVAREERKSRRGKF